MYQILHFLINNNGVIFYSDIDECVQGLAVCSQKCNNTVGSYFCTCMDGYELESDNHTCTGDQNNYVCRMSQHNMMLNKAS